MASYSTLEDLLEIDPRLVLCFYLEYCQACKEYRPIFEKAAELFRSRGVKFALIDAESCYDSGVLERLRITQLPMTVIIRDGKVVDDRIGFVTREELVDMIDRAMR